MKSSKNRFSNSDLFKVGGTRGQKKKLISAEVFKQRQHHTTTTISISNEAYVLISEDLQPKQPTSPTTSLTRDGDVAYELVPIMDIINAEIEEYRSNKRCISSRIEQSFEGEDVVVMDDEAFLPPQAIDDTTESVVTPQNAMLKAGAELILSEDAKAGRARQAAIIEFLPLIFSNKPQEDLFGFRKNSGKRRVVFMRPGVRKDLADWLCENDTL